MTDAHSGTQRPVPAADLPPLLAKTFDRGHITQLRHEVTAAAQLAGLHGQRLDDFVLAVNELVTNAVRHGGGRGWLRLWRHHQTIRCEISDNGAGIAAERLHRRERPAPNAVGGWGLWLAAEISDEMIVRTGPDGTTVRISTTFGRSEPIGADRTPETGTAAIGTATVDTAGPGE